jgi:type II secretory pathway pseudopilin PulG
MARVVLLVAASLLVASLTRVPLASGAQRELSRAERAARDAQREFESYRRFRLPRVYPRGGECDLTIGRFCYWDDNYDAVLPPERPGVDSARTRLRSTLDSLSALDSSSDYIAGQRVRYALEAGDAISGVALLDGCAATRWWCLALRGLVWHRVGDASHSTATFDSALVAMPDTLRCDWMDLRDWLPSGTDLSDSKHPDCAEQERLSARVLWLAAPLLSWRPAATRDEFLSRRTMLAILSETATPHRISWGSDLEELTLRFGWPDRWAREEEMSYSMLTTPEVKVVGHEPTPSFSFVPDRHALESPLEASPDDWELMKNRRPPMRYAPGWLTFIDTLPVQIARFNRAGGDSMVIVAAFNGRASLGDGDSTLHAAALLAVAAESTLASGHSPGAVKGAVTLAAANRPALAAVEIVDSTNLRAARWRGAVAPLERSALVSDLLVGIAGSAAPPILLDSAAPHAMAPLQLSPGDTMALYWETYAHPTPDHPTRVALRLVPLSAGFFGRIGRVFGLSHPDPPVSLAWDDPGRAAAEVGRSLRVAIPDVPRGKYRIELVVDAGGRRGRAARKIVVR